ncbi:MAG: hypothetical protein F7C33_04955 [Desulfurococcales archaeon]|nr:hypothetical protein [Desulfurococcales archaeon]
MKRVLAALLILAIIAPTLLSMRMESVSRADLVGGYMLIVMPFFTQENIVGTNGYQAIRLVAYGRMEAFVDLNHNNQLDPGEPFINKTAPGKIIVFEVRADYNGGVYNGYVGDAWIYTKYPLMAEFIAYSRDQGIIASYNMPPTGEHFLIPPIPGVVYISPDSGMPVKVSLNASGVTRSFIIKPGDYAVIPNNGSTIEIEANSSIAVVLGNPVQGPGAFFTEIPPFDHTYFTSYVPIPFPKFLLDTKTGPYNVTSYVYIVGADRKIGVLRYGSPELLSNLLEQIGSRETRGYAVVLLYHKLSNSETALAAVPVYKFHGLSVPLTDMISGSEWLTLQEVRNDTYINGSIDVVNGVPTALDTWPAVFIDLDNDWSADLLFRPYLSPIRDSIFTLGVVNSTYPFLYYQVTYWDLRYISYDLKLNLGSGAMSASYNAIPVPQSMVQDYKSVVDIRSGKYPFLIHKFYKNGAISPGFTSTSSMIGPGGKSASIVYKHNVDSTIPCSSIHYYAALITDTLKPVMWNSTTGCKIELHYTTVKPKRVYYAIPIPYVNDTVILDKATEIYVRINTTGNTQETPPSYTVARTGMKIAHYIMGEGVTGTILQTQPVIKPPSNTTKMFNLLHLTSPPPPQPTQPPTTTTTTPTHTTTTRSTPYTTSHETAKTTSYTRTRQTRTTSTQSPLNLPIPVKTGDTLEYKVKLSGKGPKGKASGSGVLVLKARVTGDEVVLDVEKNSVGSQYLGAVVNTASDLFLALASGASLHYQLPGLEPVFSSKCPVLAPQMDSKTLKGTLNVLYYKVDYTCKYSNGVLIYAKARAHGSVSGQSFNVNVEASLASTTIKGVKTSGGISGGSNLLLWAGVGIAVVVAVVALLLYVRRR